MVAAFLAQQSALPLPAAKSTLRSQVDLPEPIDGSEPSCAEQQSRRLDQPLGCSCITHPQDSSLPSADKHALQPGLHPRWPCIGPQAPAEVLHASQQ